MSEKDNEFLEEKFISHLKTTTKKAGLVFITRSISLLISFIAGVIYARVLGADLYGVYQLAVTIVLSLSLFTVFGMPGGLIRYIPIFKTEKNQEELKGVINFAILYSFFLSLAGAILLIAGRNFLSNSIFNEPRLSKILPIFAVFLILYSLRQVLGGAIKGEKEAHIFIFFNFILDYTFSILIFIGFFLFLKLKLLGISWARLISAVFILALTWKWILRRFPFLLQRPLFLLKSRKEFILYSSNLLFIGFTYFLMGQVNKLLIGMYTISKEVGFFSVSFVIAGLVVFILTSFNAIFAPLISELYHRKEFETLARMYSTITRLIWIFTLPIFLWIVIFSERILAIFGPEFVAAKYVLIFLGIGQFINAAVGPCGLMLSMSGHQKWEMANGAAVAIINIILSMLLIPRYGAAGAAVGAALALAIVNIAKTIEVWYIMKMIPYNAKYIKPLIAGAIGLATFLFLKSIFPPAIIYTFVAGIIGGLTIIATVFLLGLEKEDILLLKAVKNKLLYLYR